MSKPSSIDEVERTIGLDFVRATEAAALHVFHWIGKGDKERADGAACDAIEGMFDLIDARGRRSNTSPVFTARRLLMARR